MKRRSQILRLRWGQAFWGLRAIILAAVVILVSLGGPAHCQTEEPAPSASSGQALSLSKGVSLLLQQIPAQAGTITPGVGVHHLKPNSEIALTAIAKPGYQFVCWLGDVSDPKASSTVAYINGPKIIVALFERTDYEDLLPRASASGGGGSGASGEASGGSFSDVGNQTGLMIGGGGGTPKVLLPATPSLPVPIDLDKLFVEPPTFLAPASDEPVPEPATGILLALGSLFTFIRKQNSEDRRQK